MHIVIAVGFFVHGVAHLVGFVVPWRLATLDDAPYKTSLLGGRLDVGDAGIRFVGALWLLAAIAFVVAGVAVVFSFHWWFEYTLIVTASSLVLCVLGWPDSRFGILINTVILAYLVTGNTFGWLPAVGG